ncbi:MAG TPA: PIN domain-containing protein [Fimbriimonadaceae bacterium]|jgi:predicted nucleic acid-binding protein
MQEVILDSDLLSEILKQASQNVLTHANAYLNEYPSLTLITLSAFEMLSGLEHIQATTQLKRAEALFERNNEILPEKEDYRLASQIVGSMWRAGTPIGIVDPTIAACAIRRGLGVATGNTRHFEYIQKAGYTFHLENWRNA